MRKYQLSCLLFCLVVGYSFGIFHTLIGIQSKVASTSSFSRIHSNPKTNQTEENFTVEDIYETSLSFLKIKQVDLHARPIITLAYAQTLDGSM
jgi:hypothetical protein